MKIKEQTCEKACERVAYQIEIRRLTAENKRLAECCTQRGARMQIMREWMDNYEAGSLWTGSVWDALAEIRDADKWFDEDGVPVDEVMEDE